jgi:hypothetical protein
MPDYQKFHFSGQKPDEQILLIVRRHWFDILQQFFLIFFMLFFLLGSILYLPLLFPNLNSQPLETLFSFLENSFAMLIWIIGFFIWIDYYFDVWIITDKRVVNIEQKALFSRVVSELEHIRIQDITTEVSGLIPTFLNFGDVYIQTAAEKERFIFRQVPDPYRIKDLLMNLQKKRLRGNNEPGRAL